MPVFSIPRLGYVANYIQHPPGMYVAISGCAILVLLTFLPDLFADEEKAPPKEKKKAKKGGKFSQPRESFSADGNGEER